MRQHGVDSGASTLSAQQRAELVKQVAKRERNVVLMTGPTDYISDGERVFAISNGHELLGSVTGTGCTLGTTIASVLAVGRDDKLLAALAGILMYEIAAERAAKREVGGAKVVRGPGSFVPNFIDELYAIRQECLRGEGEWAREARVEAV